VSTEFPVSSLRHFMMPDQLVYAKNFKANNLAELDAIINAWVDETQSVIAVVGPLTQANNVYTLSLTYVSAVGGNKRVQ
jgi:hypothetical protein